MEDSGSATRMRKEINLLHASTLMTGVMIGSGIFVSPISFINNCGSVAMSLVMWILSGILSLFVALCFTELGGIYPKSGGEYTFFKEVMGPLPAFVDVWHQFLMIQPSFQALLALTATNYMIEAIFPGNCDIPDVAVRFLTVWIIVSVVILNSVYVKYITRVQTVLTVIKCLSLLAIISVGFVQLGRGNFENLRRGFQNTKPDIGSHAIAVHSGIFTYMGWQYLFCLMDEVKDPERIVPRSTSLSIITVTVLYTLTNVAYFTVLSPEDMMTSKAVAWTFAEKTMGRASVIVPFCVACSAIGSLNGSILGGSRYYFAAAKDNLFPSVMSTIHVTYLTPWPALFGVTLISVFYVAIGEAVTLLEYLGFGATAMLFLALVCLLHLRRTQPELKRPFKVHIAIPIVCVTILGFLIVFGIYQAPQQNGIATLIVLSGVPVYYLVVRWASKFQPWRAQMYKYSCWIQKCLLTVPESKDC